MIQVENLSKRFGHKLAVNRVSFEVKKGEVLAFIGPNGAGKSTTMRMITGFIPSSEGRVQIGPYDMLGQPLYAKKMVGYLPENAPLYTNKTVGEFLDFIAEVRGFRGIAKRKRVESALETCFLQPVRNQSIDTLSKGYRHRTCFAQAILHDPEILILDEPTDGLDPNQKREMRNLIRALGEHKAIIISTHILEEVGTVAARVILIDQGKKIFDGTTSEFRSRGKSLDEVFRILTSGTMEV